MIGQIISVVIGLVVYNIFMKAVGMTILKMILQTETAKREGEKIKKSFKERLNEE